MNSAAIWTQRKRNTFRLRIWLTANRKLLKIGWKTMNGIWGMFRLKSRRDLEKLSSLSKTTVELLLTTLSSSLRTIKSRKSFGLTLENPLKNKPIKRPSSKRIFSKLSPKSVASNLGKSRILNSFTALCLLTWTRQQEIPEIRYTNLRLCSRFKTERV